MAEKVIGFTDGVYDLFHVGHLNMIHEAKKRCDYLIVGVHSDAIVEEYKHRKPVIPQEERLAIVAALRDVDQAVLNETRDKLTLWERYHFNVVMIGDDWRGTDRWNHFEEVLGKIGVRVEYIPYTQGISTTMLRERMSAPPPQICTNREQTPVVGFITGVYDLFHIGHLNIIQEAKKHCEYLIVGVHSDAVVESYKHHKPQIPQEERLEIISGLREVDQTVLNQTRDKLALWKLYHYHIIMAGDDWKGSEHWNHVETMLAPFNVKVEYLPYTKGISTSIIQRRLQNRDIFRLNSS